MAGDALYDEVSRRVEELGFERVELKRAGNARRPIFRLTIDRRPDAVPGTPGVSVDDCARVSRALEPWLDARADVPEGYVLEVSSPGVERPLVRRRDWARFAGQEVAVHGTAPLHADARRVEGTLLGPRGDGAEARVALRLADGAEVEVPLDLVERAHLVFRWERGRGGGAKPRRDHPSRNEEQP